MKITNKQTLFSSFILCLAFFAVIFESCTSKSLEVGCEKGVWYKSKLKSPNSSNVPMNVSVKFTDNYTLVELFNQDVHEVYKLAVTNAANPTVFETGEFKNKYNDAQLTLESVNDQKEIVISFRDLDENLQFESQTLELTKG